MKGDFTRDTFEPHKHFTRVLMQQGRVQLDADWNEQASILLHYLQALAEDLIGPHAGPADYLGYEIKPQGMKKLTIGVGRYYVNGIPCENEEQLAYTSQADYPLPDAAALENGKTYLVYLDVWERHITCIEDDGIRKVALGGPDTATRAKVVRQVKTTNKTPNEEPIPSTPPEGGTWRKWVEGTSTRWAEWIAQWQSTNRGMLKARVKPQAASTDPCITSPDSRYRGAENQLYRVEIHRGGKAWDGSENDKQVAATFKWSRDNGSATFPIRKLVGKEVTLEHLGRDSRFGLAVGDWVVIADDGYVLQGRSEPLLQIDAIDPVNMQVTLNALPIPGFGQDPAKHPLLRRWDHKAGDPTTGGLQLQGGAAMITEGADDQTGWLTLEDGVQIQFQEPAPDQPNHHQYRTGDYWLIPARTATGDVEWPQVKDGQGNPIPIADTPHGVEHHYAPLAIIALDGGGNVTVSADLRRMFKLLGQPV